MCVAFGCSNHTTGRQQGTSFHRFPKEVAQKNAWIWAVQRENWSPSATSVLCSIHFEEQYIDRTALNCVRLKQGAVPTIFPGFPVQANVQARQEPATTIDIPSSNSVCNSTKRVQAADGDDSPRTKKPRQGLHCRTNSLSQSRKRMQLLYEVKRRMCKSKKVATTTNVIESLKEKNLIDDDHCGMLTGICKISQNLLKKKGKMATNSKQLVYDRHLRSFAITLHYLSPKAYSYVRQKFNTCLPHAKMISSWYQTVNANPGFSSEVLQVLKDMATSNQVICALMLDSMAIRQHLEWGGHHFHGVVNIGVESDDDLAPLATEALVFHLVCINQSWQVPIGYFLTDGASGHQLCGLVMQCLILLHDVNVQVVSLTCKATVSNISMANQLGCSISHEYLQTNFPHPSNGQPVYFFLDPCHMLKLVRNTLRDKKHLMDGDDKMIAWDYIDKLDQLQNRHGLQQTVKCKLAAQTLSDSIADALVYCITNGITGFEGATETAKFIRIFNKLFDILNSRSIYSNHDKQALNVKNIIETKVFIQGVQHYIRNLKDSNGKLLLTTNRRTGFLGFLTCMESTCLLYNTLIGDSSSKYPLKYLPTYKFSEDHLERIFARIRSTGGHNDLTTKQFSVSYRRILVQSELCETQNQNCLPFDKTCILNVASTSKSPIKAINESLTRFRLLDNIHIQDIPGNDYIINNGINDTSEMASYIVEYIAGFIAQKLERKIMCEECSLALQSTSCQNFRANGIKNKVGPLMKPSQDVNIICKFCERSFRLYFRDQQLPSDNAKLLDIAIVLVVEMCYSMKLFTHLSDHFLEHVLPNENHYLLLIQAISRMYFKIRLHHYTKLPFNSELEIKMIRSHFSTCTV